MQPSLVMSMLQLGVMGVEMEENWHLYKQTQQQYKGGRLDVQYVCGPQPAGCLDICEVTFTSDMWQDHPRLPEVLTVYFIYEIPLFGLYFNVHKWVKGEKNDKN